MTYGFIAVDAVYTDGASRLFWIEVADDQVLCSEGWRPGAVLPDYETVGDADYDAHCIAYGINEGMAIETTYGGLEFDEDFEGGLLSWRVRDSGVSLLRRLGIV